MDAIDNLIYTTLNECIYPSGFVGEPVSSDYQFSNLDAPSLAGGTFPTEFSAASGVSSYATDAREVFSTIDDIGIVESAVKKHWFDVANRISYTTQFGEVDVTGTDFGMFDPASAASPMAYIKFNTPPYHLIFSYLVENTRIVQIFEKLIWMFLHDEKLTKADPKAFAWIMNTEALFYKDSMATPKISGNSGIKPVTEAARRNAYHRLFGMDLAFGDQENKSYEYVKAEFANSAFISLFENFLSEFWQGFINANNTSGQNTTDYEHLEALGRKIQEMLMSRRSTELDFANYRYFHLSREEYSSYIFLYWLFSIISYDSPVVTYLNANANTPGERLISIGKKVGVPAHTKSKAILDISQPMNIILRSVELGLFNDANFLRRIIRSQATVNPIVPAATAQETAILDNILLIINNWEKATGHMIKNPETKLNGTLKIEQKQMKPVLSSN